MSAVKALPGMVPTAVQHVGTVDGVRQLATNTWVARIKSPELARQILPGQFFMVRPVDGSDPLLGRPFALFDAYSDADGNPLGLRIGFVVVGKMTALMTRWSVGDKVSLWGPLGNGFPIPDCNHLACVAGGIGQTPFVPVLREAAGLSTYGDPARRIESPPAKLTMCYGVRSADYLAGVEDFEIPGVSLHISTDDGTAGHHGFVTEVLRNLLDSDDAPDAVYCCGPEPMMKATAEVCAEKNTACWLSLETPMACGFGACFSCVTKVCEPNGSWDYKRTCVEGPVFKAERLIL